MELLSAFQLPLAMPSLSDEELFAAVFTAAGALSPSDSAAAAAHFAGKSVSIKKLLLIIEMAQQADPEEGGLGAAVSAAGAKRMITVELITTAIEWGI